MMTQEDIARLRIKARRGELTPEEQLLYSDYMEQEQAMPAKTPVMPAQDDSGSFGWAVLGFFIPIVGLVLYLVWREQKPLSAKKAGMGALVSVIAGIVLSVLWFIIVAVILGSAAGNVTIADDFATYGTMLRAFL